VHQAFLATLRERPADHLGWLVYADWLDEQNDPTGRFIRLSLELTNGQVGIENARAWVEELEQLYTSSHPATRELLAAYRSSLPTRFRVLEPHCLGEDTPQEMFAYPRTIAIGFLESGRVKPGMNLGVGVHADGRPRILQSIEVFLRVFDEVAAGQVPIHVGLVWLGHLPIEVGSVLTVEHSASPSTAVE